MNFSDIQENIKNMLPVFYKKVNTEDGELLLPATPSEIEYIRTPNPHVFISFDHLPQHNLPQTLTHQLYLDIRRREETTGCFNYLNFTNKTYLQHFSTSLHRSWVCFKSSFYFFIQGFYPDAFQHYGTDLVVKLSENILDEYSAAINDRVDNLV